MRVQLCSKEKNEPRTHVLRPMPVKEARKIFTEMDNDEITLAFLRRWEGYGYVCYKVLKGMR